MVLIPFSNESLRPLILASTRAILDSVVNSAKSIGAAEDDGVLRPCRSHFADEDGGSASAFASLRLKAGILRVVHEGAAQMRSLTSCRPSYSPCILLLRHFDVFANLSSNEGSPSDQAGITSEVASVIREFSNPLPEDDESYPAKDANGGLSINDEFIRDVIAQTLGFMPRDILALVADAGASFVQRVLIQSDIVEKRGSPEISSTSSMPIQDNNGVDKYESKHLGREDFSRALERSKKRNASALGTPKVPNVKWEDVGRLEEVKKSILDTVQIYKRCDDKYLAVFWQRIKLSLRI
uniref:Uncharacterized protein n=1 Tax=Ananas comosus var. bracteatus TaxID=296719 RepID=A0A6V7P5H9_ANACO|nr:unnamed protein product [Ananas comosus var. bracteatus]